jgi:signal peptidase I
VVSAGTLLATLVLAWIFVAPLALGGQNSYLITSGGSMLPGIERGDLVVTRGTDEYRVGDVVAYQDPRIGAVLHRIIAIEGGRYVLQGDNNDFIDPYRPEHADIMGKLALHLPGVGNWLSGARQPRNAAILALAGGMLFAAPLSAHEIQQARRQHRRGSGGGNAPHSRRHSGNGRYNLSPSGQIIGVVVAGIFLASLTLGLFAFTMSTEKRAAVPVGFEHHGQFHYEAETSGTVYSSGRAVTGEPVYRQLADEIAVQFDYRLVSSALLDVSGVYRMDAVIRQDDGWTRTLPVVSEAEFTGSELTIHGLLNLDRIQAEVDSARAQTGLDSQPLRAYSVDIVPSVTLGGMLAATPLHETFEPSLRLTVEPLLVKVKSDSSSGPDSTAFQIVSTGSISEYRNVPTFLPMPGYQMRVDLARNLAQIGLALSVVGALLLIVVVSSSSSADEPARIRARYGSLLITLRSSDLGEDMRVIEVASIEDLVRIAEREGRMILHQELGSLHRYFVQDIDVTYRFQWRPETTERRWYGAERPL